MRLFASLIVLCACSFSSFARTAPLFKNSGLISNSIPPYVDARVFENRGAIYAQPGFGGFFGGGFGGGVFGNFLFGFGRSVYNTFNTHSFYNFGLIQGDALRFANVNYQGAIRPAIVISNIGDIQSDYIDFRANRIINPGDLTAGVNGLIKLTGRRVDIENGFIQTGIFFNQGGGGSRFGIISNQFYVNPTDPAVRDIYSAVGTNGSVEGQGQQLRLPPATLTLPAPITPGHDVFVANSFFGGPTRSQLIVPGALAYVYDDPLVTQVVFVPTNSSNVAIDVRFGDGVFAPNQGPGKTIFVEFSSGYIDPLTQRPTTNTVYLLDMSLQQTNITTFREFLQRDLNNGGARPNSFELVAGPVFEYLLATPPNATYSPDLLYNNTFSNSVVDYLYSAYSAQISSQSLAPRANPTNQPGRIEIRADTLNLKRSRIRAQGLLDIQANHIQSSEGALSVAPRLFLNLGSRTGSLSISNMVPFAPPILQGGIRAWSAVWSNAVPMGTNITNKFFQVLVVDSTLRAASSAGGTETMRLTTRANNVRIDDPIVVTEKFLTTARNFTLADTLRFSGTVSNVGFRHFPRLLRFQNEGNLTTDGSLTLGRRTPNRLLLFENTGTISSFGQTFRANEFSNLGTLRSGASLEIGADLALVSGSVTADGILSIAANTLVLSNVTASASGRFEGGFQLSIRDSLIEPEGVVNNIITGSGFVFSRRPFEGGLLQSTITSVAGAFEEAAHISAGADFGATPDGFVNNLAVGTLVLQGSNGSLFTFRGTSTEPNALYVENLVINISNPVAQALNVEPGFVLYYRNSNLSEAELSVVSEGRVQRVP